MYSPIKQRLVGIVIFMAIVLVFLPVLFHNSRPGLNKEANNVDSNASPKLEIIQPAQTSIPLANLENVKPQPVASAPAPKEKPVEKIEKNENLNVNPLSMQQAEEKLIQPPQRDTKKADLEVVPTDSQLKKSVDVKAWVIQLASFADQNRSKDLVTKLRKLGYDCYLRNVESKGKHYYQVYIGPVIQLDKIKSLQLKLNQELNQSGIIKPYTPL